MADTHAEPRFHREDRDQVAVLSLDYPGRSMNVVDESVFEELRAHVADIRDASGISAVVLTSGKTSFGAGADVEWLPELMARGDAEGFLSSVHDLMRTIADSSKPYVSAVRGAALGGALEVVLSTHAIVATPDARLGLPEITLGIMPGGAGTQLIRRFVDTETALRLLLGGRAVDASTAHDMGLVAAIAEDDDLLADACALALELASGAAMRPGVRETRDEALRAIEARSAETSGPAATILDVVRIGAAEGWDAGCEAERRSFIGLVNSQEAKARIHIFQAEGAVKRRGRGTATAPRRIGVLGGGQMGSGIAATAASRGLTAVVRDIGEDQLARSRAYLEKVLARSAGDRREEFAANWSATTDWDGFGELDAVIEAVFELPDVKREALELVSARVGEHAIVATNTSAIPVGSLASAVSRPERFLGMHFFSPVERMPLVELVPHERTARETVERACSLARALGKVPVVVADAPGFFTSRVYARWLIEGVRLLLDGAAPDAIDAAARAAGFPVGPMQAHDEATLDLVVKASVTQVAEPVMADRLDVGAVRGALEKLVAAGVQGRRLGAGFYLYEDGKRTGTNPAVASALGIDRVDIDAAVIADRLLLAFATECFLCWDDGTVCHPDDGDVAAVLGIGFPRALGGPFHWADQEGAQALVDRCTGFGLEAFPTGGRLTVFAEGGGAFANEERLPAPGRPT